MKFFKSKAGLLFKALCGVIVFVAIVVLVNIYFPQIRDSTTGWGITLTCGVFAFYFGGSLFMSLIEGDEMMGTSTTYVKCPHCTNRLSIYNIPADSNEPFICPHCKITINGVHK